MKGLSTLYDNSENAHNDDIFKSAISILRQLASTTDEKTLQLNSDEIIGDIINEEKVALLQMELGNYISYKIGKCLPPVRVLPPKALAPMELSLPEVREREAGKPYLTSARVSHESYVRMLFRILPPKVKISWD